MLLSTGWLQPNYLEFAPCTQVAFIGRWPGKGPRGQDLDPSRRKRAGTPMSDRWAVVEYRGDWIHVLILRFPPKK